jgi:hypothetical protein
MKGRLSIAAGVAALAVSGGIAYATIPGSGGVVSACYSKAGDLRVIDAEGGAPCKSGETPLSWNQQGPKGDPGPQGEPGPSDAYFGRRGGWNIDIPQGETRTVATLLLPKAGNYVLFGHFRFTSGVQDFVGCDLKAGEVIIDSDQLVFSWLFGSILLTGALTLDQPATVTVVCRALGGDVHHAWSTFEAIRVATLVDTGGAPTS